MASAFKCDLCGRLYEDYDGFQYDEKGGSHFKKIFLSSDSTSRNFDTCPNCMRAIICSMNARKEKSDGVF